MKTIRQTGWMMATAMGIALTMQAAAQQNAATPQNLASRTPKRMIVVSLQDRELALVEDGKVKAMYKVAVGKPSTPSPVGTFTIERRVVNPTYYHHGRVIPPGPANPVGNRWMGLSIRGYGIHGTNNPRSIGKAASHGCIRMGKADLEMLFAQVKTGDTVELIGTRNQETAQYFGPPSNPAPASSSQPVLTAEVHPTSSANISTGSM